MSDGNDAMLAAMGVTQQDLLEKVIDDDNRRRWEEEKVAAQPHDGDMG